MITAGDFRKGITVEIDGSVFVIVDFLHVKPGKGAAFIQPPHGGSGDCPQERLRGRKPFYRRIQEVDRSHPFRLPALQLKIPDRYPRPGFRFSIPFNFQNLPL